MKRTPLSRRTPLRHTRPVTRRNAKRRASEFASCYHSRARVRWIKAQPCIICGHGPCDNAHTVTGGTGRKANYETIVPLCCMGMWDEHSPGYQRGHHGLLHQIGVLSFERAYGVDLKAEAARTHARWLAAAGGEA